MTRLSVNINKVALIRNSRGANYPNLAKIATDLEQLGAQGITVHPRPDERHIRYSDIPVLKNIVTTEFNVEGNPTPEFLEMVLKHKPHQCTLVPDKPGALTSNNGWDTIEHESFLTEVIQELSAAGIRSSIFINPEEAMIEGAAKVNTDRIEFYTGPYADAYHTNREAVIAPFTRCAELCESLNIGVNAGHDLNLENLKYFANSVPFLDEVSIGHALISDALYLGLEKTIESYKNCLIK